MQRDKERDRYSPYKRHNDRDRDRHDYSSKTDQDRYYKRDHRDSYRDHHRNRNEEDSHPRSSRDYRHERKRSSISPKRSWGSREDDVETQRESHRKTRRIDSPNEKQRDTPDISHLNEEEQMMALMGFGGFNTTKDKHVEGNEDGAAKVNKTVKYRQFMNRKRTAGGVQ